MDNRKGVKMDKEFIKKAYSSVPMYIRMADRLGIDVDNIDDINELPIITKEEIMDNDSVLASHCISLLYGKKLMEKRTSGSTGKYLNVYWKNEDYIRSMFPLWIMRKKYYDISPDDKMCFFYTITEVENEKDSFREKNMLGFSKSKLNEDKLKEIFSQMREFYPKWLILQPSIGLLLCQFMDRYDIKPIDSIKYIEMSGELLTKETRQKVEKHFNCRVADQYGAHEFNSIAYECPYGNMHIMERNVIVEVMNNGKKVQDGNEGELVITTRTNSAMPLIRYKIGDIGKICTGQCSCGSKWKMFKLTSGRVNDYILSNAGERITSYVFVRALDVINYKMDGIIKQFQIIQTAIDEFRIRLIVDEAELDRCNAISKLFKESVLDERLCDARYIFEYGTELIPNESNGKYAYFKRLIG